MKDIYALPARAEDIQTLDTWLRETPENLFDPDILQYRKHISFLGAYNGTPLMFLPLQNVLMLESLAVKPGATELEIAKSIEVLMKCIIYTARDGGFNELLFVCKDERVNAYAERHGFETMLNDEEKKIKLFRLKVGKLCRTTPELSGT